jgi:hypothetical protein
MEIFLASIFVVLILTTAFGLVRAAISARLIGPVVVGAAVRLAVMLAAHLGSVATGGHGFMFLDDQGYAKVAGLLADQWREGNFVDPASYQFAGSYVFGFPTLVALIFLLTDENLLAAKLVNVLLGTATILVTARIGRQLGGERAARYTAWLVAISPTVVWWTAPLLKEALVAFLVSASVLFALQFPRARAFTGLLLGLFGLALTRIPAVLGVGAGVCIAWLAAAWIMRKRVSWPAFAILAVLGTLLGAVALAVVAQGNPVALLAQYASTVRSTTAAYPGGDPRGIPADVVRTAVAPYPWAFDPGTQSWYRALYPGMWVWYLLLPTAALGFFRLRRRAEVWLFATPIAFLVLASALTSGFTIRQRSSIEPIVLVLVALGVDSWRKVFRRGSVAIFAIALFAMVQSYSLVVGAIVAAAAVAVLLVGEQLPGGSARAILQPSPLLEGSLAVTLPEGVSLAALRAHVPAPKRVGAQGALARIHAAALAVVPPVPSSSTALGTAARWPASLGMIHASVVAAAAWGRRPLRMLRAQAPEPEPLRVPVRIYAMVLAAAPTVGAASTRVSSRFEPVRRIRADALRSLRPAGAGAHSVRTLRAHVPDPRPARTPARLETFHAALVAAAPPARSASSALSNPATRFAAVTRARAAVPPPGQGRGRR